MQFRSGLTRRDCLRMLLAVPALQNAAVTHRRYYQAGAQILFCGMQVFSIRTSAVATRWRKKFPERGRLQWHCSSRGQPAGESAWRKQAGLYPGDSDGTRIGRAGSCGILRVYDQRPGEKSRPGAAGIP